MDIEVITKDKQLINLSKEDFIIKETLLEAKTTIMSLVTLKIRYGIMEDLPDLEDYNNIFSGGKDTANLSDTDFINMLKSKPDNYIVNMLEHVLTYYLNNLLKYVAELNLSIDSVFEDYQDLLEYAKDQAAKGDKRITKVLYIFSNMMFSLFFHNMKYKDGLRDQTKENIVTESYTDEETGKEHTRHLVPYCLALRTTICGMVGEFKLRSEINKIRDEVGFKPYKITPDHMLYNYFEKLYDKSSEFHDNKVMEIAYMDSKEEFGTRIFKLYRTLDQDYIIVF